MKALKVGIINYRSRSAYALKLLKGKKTTSQIATICGMTPQTVSRLKRDHGFLDAKKD